MSSEGSVTSSGSRIRQFGLYRTIDARTEEFLRSSRKRQIRQGCACAAISTAITVTVVVSVILVYEYSVNSDSNVNRKILLKPNWLGSMNESDIKSFDSKFTKKINIDRTTLKLLPILLKALNKNRYLEKVLEDYSSSSPSYSGKDSTETTFKRNVFADSKNWLKMPTSKLYTVDYKTSPLVYWKSPTTRLEYLTKIRKIRDYQRMLNYFDKMINERVGSNPKREYEYTENTLMAETMPMRVEKKKEIQQAKYLPQETINNLKELKNEELEHPITSCKCPKKLGLLLSKLLSGIQSMIPSMIGNKLGIHNCGNKTETHKHEVDTPQAGPRPRERVIVNEYPTTLSMGLVRKTARKLNRKFTTIAPKLAYNTKKRMIVSQHHRITTSKPTTTTSTTESTTYLATEPQTERTTTTTESSTATDNDIITETATTTERSYLVNRYYDEKIIRLPVHVNTQIPVYQIYEKNTLDYDSIVKPTDEPYIDTTRNQHPKPTTEPFVPIKFIDASNEVSSTEPAVKPLHMLTISPLLNRPTIPVYREEEYDDYFLTTQKTTINDIENLDVHSLELIKTKMMSSHSNEHKFKNTLNKISFKAKPLNYHPVYKQKDLDLNSMRKMADLIYLPKERNIKGDTATQSRIHPTLPDNFSQRLHSTTTEVNNAYPIETSSHTDTIKTSNVDKANIKTVNADVKVPEAKAEAPETKLTLDQANLDNLMEEEFQEEYGLKPSEPRNRPTYKYKYPGTFKMNTTHTREILQEQTTTTTTAATTTMDVSKNEEKIAIKGPESMLPSMRPIYLEVQRNSDWRQDDHADYDINLTNNIFDLPNI